MTDMSNATDATPGTDRLGRKTKTFPTAIEKRKMHKLLEEHLDCQAQEYRPGWDDEAIAKAVGVARDSVVRLRRHAYCMLRNREGAAKTAKQTIDVEALEKRLEETLTVMTDLKLENFGHALTALREQVNTMRDQIEAARDQMRSVTGLLALPQKIAGLESQIRELRQERALTHPR